MFFLISSPPNQYLALECLLTTPLHPERERLREINSQALKIFATIKANRSAIVTNFGFKDANPRLALLSIDSPCSISSVHFHGKRFASFVGAQVALNYLHKAEDSADLIDALAQESQIERIEKITRRALPYDLKDPKAGSKGFEFTKTLLTNYEKFSQNPLHKAALLSTGSDYLAYCFDEDLLTEESASWQKIWGHSLNGQGENLLGYTLMTIREIIKQHVVISPWPEQTNLAYPIPGDKLQELSHQFHALTLTKPQDPSSIFSICLGAYWLAKNNNEDISFFHSILSQEIDCIIDLRGYDAPGSKILSNGIASVGLQKQEPLSYYPPSLIELEKGSCGFFVQDLKISTEHKQKTLPYISVQTPVTSTGFETLLDLINCRFDIDLFAPVILGEKNKSLQLIASFEEHKKARLDSSVLNTSSSSDESFTSSDLSVSL